jgi:hypothetical protein
LAIGFLLLWRGRHQVRLRGLVEVMPRVLVGLVMVVELRTVVVSVIAASPSRLALDLGPTLEVGLPSHHEVETQFLTLVVLKNPFDLDLELEIKRRLNLNHPALSLILASSSLLYPISPYPNLTSYENHTALRWNDSNRGLIGSSWRGLGLERGAMLGVRVGMEVRLEIRLLQVPQQRLTPRQGIRWEVMVLGSSGGC